ncbi:dipicolinate synthase subunit DpsA [Paenibacillus antri]|uniref:Dipicolinate synthase subunit DpsA n=1 Tax=Paenibacillus antri TaxID=2582848 RepID=A0A5R9GHJ3_9BACL|nr:dipicolinate synthase subunit DpsA [Paenibacillus antri]TLS52253.1 dipicolinate synthase subunit DpsA [Paenibacillus antri]
MLTGTQVAFIGGDARQLEVIQRLTELDASVTLIGFDNLKQAFNGATHAELTEDAFADLDAVLLPVVGTDDEGKVEGVFTSKELRLTDACFARLPKHAKVYAGIAKPYLRNLCQKHGIALIELLERDDVAIYNSIPTAEGALLLAIQNTDITIHGSTTLVIGFGRTGMTMARTLLGLGAKVLVGVRKEDHYARAYEMGFQPFHTSRLQQYVGDADIVFNTVPTPILTARVIAAMPPRAVIIDLASKPGGTDFRFAERRGVKALLAPGLPGIVAPKTAGRIIATVVSQLIMEDTAKRGKEA